MSRLFVRVVEEWVIQPRVRYSPAGYPWQEVRRSFTPAHPFDPRGIYVSTALFWDVTGCSLGEALAHTEEFPR